MTRRPLSLACIVLLAVPIPSAFGQATLLEGLQDRNGINLDTMLDELAEQDVAKGSSSSNSPKVEDETADDEETKEEEVYTDDIVVEPDEPQEQGTSAGDIGGGVGGEFFATKMSKKRPKRGNKMCGWSWRERRCQPAPLCDYKYQFLDATLSESCRRKDFTVSREVFETSDIKVQPAVALAGAAGLFAADLLAIGYTDLLQRFPMLFNVVQGFVLFVSGDTLFQVLEQGWKSSVGIRFWRMIRSGIIGALNNGLVHYSYYKWIDKRFPYDKFTEKRWGPTDGSLSKLAVGFTKWAIEWPTIGVYKIASMYVLTALMSGSMEGLLERMGDSLFLTWLRSLQVWPIYDMILYAYVPTAHRPLFNSFMSIAWGGYLSHVSQPHEPNADDNDDIPVETS